VTSNSKITSFILHLSKTHTNSAAWFCHRGYFDVGYKARLQKVSSNWKWCVFCIHKQFCRRRGRHRRVTASCRQLFGRSEVIWTPQRRRPISRLYTPLSPPSPPPPRRPSPSPLERRLMPTSHCPASRQSQMVWTDSTESSTVCRSLDQSEQFVVLSYELGL